MTKRTVKDYLDEIRDKLNSKIKERDSLLMKIDTVSKEIMSIVNQQYSLDPTKTRIKCINCRGMGYVVGEDNKKKLCSVCNGDRFNWAELFIEEKEKEKGKNE